MSNEIADINDIESAQKMKRVKANKDGENKSRGKKKVEKTTLSDLPESIISNILVKIPPRYIYKNFMPVSRVWKKMFSTRFFVEQNFMESKTELVIQAATREYLKTKLIMIGKELEFELRDVGMTQLREARSSCDGLLLMNGARNTGKLHVINPVTKCCIPLPICPSGCLHKACSAALGFDSLTKQYKVVHVVTDSHGFEMFNFGSLANEWERVPGPWEDSNDRPFNPVGFRWKDPVSINGRLLHWFVNSCEYIISMQVKEAKISRTYLPKLGKKTKKESCALVELGGFLSFVYCVSDNEMDVWILEDFQEQVWSKKHTIVAAATNFICPSQAVGQYEETIPNLGKLVAAAGARNGEVLILKHKNANRVYIYDTESRTMKKLIISMENLVSFIPHKDSLFCMKCVS